jgi:DNA-binding transcriptional MerR regulator
MEELAELTGFTRRTIRYYIQEGILEPPAGRGRGGFYYDSHVDALKRIKAMQEKGLNLYSIAAQLGAGADNAEAPQVMRRSWAKYEIIPGLNIDVVRELEDTENKRVSELIRVARALFREDKIND